MSETSVLDTAPVETDSPALSSDREAASFDFTPPEKSEAEPQFVDPDEEAAPLDDAGESEESPPESGDTEVDASAESPFDAELISAAERHGYTPEQLKGFGTPAALQLHLAGLDRQAIAWGKSQLGEPAAAEQAATEPQTATQTRQAALEKLKLELDPDAWDEGAIKTFNGINDHYHELVSKQQAELDEQRDFMVAMHEQFSQLTGQAKQAEAVQVERELDTFFESLGDEYGELYGKGTIRSLPQDSTAVKERREFYREMRALELADAHQNRPPMARAEMQKRVLASLHPDKIEQSVRHKLTQKIGERKSQTIARPAGKHTKPQTEDEKALQFLRQNVPKLGY